MRVLPRSPRGTWLLAAAVWLAGSAALWWALPYRPRAVWATGEPAALVGFVPGSSVLLTCSPWRDGIDGPPRRWLGPLVFRDVETGGTRGWFGPDDELTVGKPLPDGRRLLIGRSETGRTRLRLYAAEGGEPVADLPFNGRTGEANAPPEFDARGDEPAVAVRPDGRRIAYADWQGEGRCVRVWD